MGDRELGRGLLVALLLGSLLGALSSFGDVSGIVVVNALANAASPWLVTAFMAGALLADSRRGALAGLVALVVALAWYYGRWIGSELFPIAFALAWLGLVALTGPALGALGGTWASRSDRWRTIAVALLVGALLAEAAHRLILLEAWDGFDPARTYAQLALANLVLAGVLVISLLERRRWADSIAAAAVVAVLGLGVLAGVDRLFRLLADIMLAGA